MINNLQQAIIINVGTFGWWAGYLGCGTVVYPEHFNQHCSWTDPDVTNNFYPPNWIL